MKQKKDFKPIETIKYKLSLSRKFLINKIEFLPETKAELDDAVEYYELQVKGLGITFKGIAKSTVKRVATFPTAWTEIKPSIRRCIMHKFPYNVLYSIEENYILKFIP